MEPSITLLFPEHTDSVKFIVVLRRINVLTYSLSEYIV